MHALVGMHALVIGTCWDYLSRNLSPGAHRILSDLPTTHQPGTPGHTGAHTAIRRRGREPARRAARHQCHLDTASVLVDELSELRDRGQRASLAPPRDVGDALAIDGEPSAGADDEGDSFMPGLERFELWRGRPGLAGSVTCFLFVLPT